MPRIYCHAWYYPQLRPWMCLLITLPQAVHRDMGVDLSGGEAAVAQDLLDGPEIRAPVQEVRGRGMPQGVGSGSGGIPQCFKELLHDGPDLALVHPVATRSKEEGRPAVRLGQRRPAPPEPVVDRDGSRNTVW